jgi:hypothetical protein
VVGNPKSAPVSVTHAKPARSAQPEAAPANVAAPQPSAAGGRPQGAEVKVGRVVLQGGHINFTDNFIKPHYTADLTAPEMSRRSQRARVCDILSAVSQLRRGVFLRGGAVFFGL